MSILESYLTNRPLRETYFRINGITHAEVCDATDSCEYRDPMAYKVMLTNGDSCGWFESSEFSTVGAALGWCHKYAPELEVIG